MIVKDLTRPPPSYLAGYSHGYQAAPLLPGMRTLEDDDYEDKVRTGMECLWWWCWWAGFVAVQ